jgi:Mg2+ and Co2+ transporter CorA
MAVGFAFSSRAAELLNLVIERLEAEFPEMPRGQVARCVGVARDSANSTASDLAAYANIVEALARNYLATLQSVKAKS